MDSPEFDGSEVGRVKNAGACAEGRGGERGLSGRGERGDE